MPTLITGRRKETTMIGLHQSALTWGGIVQAQGPAWVLLGKRKVRLPAVYAAEIYKPMRLSTRSNSNP